MTHENIGTGVHFTSLHLHSFYQHEFGYKRGDFPNAEFISDRTVSLPLTSGMNENDIDDVVNAVRKVIELKASRRQLSRSMTLVTQ
jgi:dTDP-4-amino-4,6-dideoxygalactose transaminase